MEVGPGAPKRLIHDWKWDQERLPYAPWWRLLALDTGSAMGLHVSKHSRPVKSLQDAICCLLTAKMASHGNIVHQFQDSRAESCRQHQLFDAVYLTIRPGRVVSSVYQHILSEILLASRDGGAGFSIGDRLRPTQAIIAVLEFAQLLGCNIEISWLSAEICASLFDKKCAALLWFASGFVQEAYCGDFCQTCRDFCQRAAIQRNALHFHVKSAAILGKVSKCSTHRGISTAHSTPC